MRAPESDAPQSRRPPSLNTGTVATDIQNLCSLEIHATTRDIY